MSAPLVSVVTPVYNTGRFLAECIESVLAQSFTDFEYVIVNNCSTDDSLDIARRYANRDARIRIVDNDVFLTQQQNYNHALRQIDPGSRYCKMVQADDWILPGCIGQMVATAESDPRVAMVGSYQLSGLRVKCQGIECKRRDPPYSVIEGRDACRLFLLEHRYLFGTNTTLLYRSDLVRSRKNFYREDSLFEDSEVCFELLGSYRFGFVHQVLSYTRVGNEQSISTDMQDLGPELLHIYLITKLYGALHLDADELPALLERSRRDYYDMLAGQLFRRRDPRFWNYHREGLRMAGESLDRRLLFTLGLRRVVDWIGNPLNASGAARAWLRRRMSR